jgi:hypothetical protein
MQSIKSSGHKKLTSAVKESSKKTLDDLEKLDEISEIKVMEDVSAIIQEKPIEDDKP